MRINNISKKIIRKNKIYFNMRFRKIKNKQLKYQKNIG